LRKSVEFEVKKVIFPITFKFETGYTNAVKRRVTVADWLPQKEEENGANGDLWGDEEY